MSDLLLQFHFILFALSLVLPPFLPLTPVFPLPSPALGALSALITPSPCKQAGSPAARQAPEAAG